MIPPIPSWSKNNAKIVNKYFPKDRWDGVRCNLEIGSSAGGVNSCSSCLRPNAHIHTTIPIPQSKIITLTTDQATLSGVGLWSNNGSWGQLLVYVASVPGRWVDAIHVVQKKNRAISIRSFNSGNVLSFIAKWSRVSDNLGLSPYSSIKYCPVKFIAVIRSGESTTVPSSRTALLKYSALTASLTAAFCTSPNCS